MLKGLLSPCHMLKEQHALSMLKSPVQHVARAYSFVEGQMLRLYFLPLPKHSQLGILWLENSLDFPQAALKKIK